MRWYFAHPHTNQTGGRMLAEELTLRTGHELVNPFDYETRTENDEWIVSRDLALIADCDGLVAWLPADARPVGTMMEIFWASRILGKPVVVLTHPPFDESPWLLAHGAVHHTVMAVAFHMKQESEACSETRTPQTAGSATT